MAFINICAKISKAPNTYGMAFLYKEIDPSDKPFCKCCQAL